MDTERGFGIVGGGAAGLAAAWRLSQAGRRVRVYEASERPGGALDTVEVGGVPADPVVQLLSDGYGETRRMLASLGLEDRLVHVPGRDALWRRGSAHPVRYGSFASMLASRALPSGLKLKLGLRYLPFLERHLELTMHEPARAAALDGQSIADWGRRELGDDFVELLAYPLLASYYGVTPEETSAAFFHGLAKAGMHVEVLGARGGMGELAAALAAELERRGVEIRTGARVSGVEANGRGASLRIGSDQVEHDGVVLAVPPREAARLVPGLPAVPRARAMATLVLATRRPLRTGWFGLSIPRTEAPGRTLAALCVQEEKGTGLGGDGGALVVVPAPAVAERWAESEQGTVLEEALPAVERVLPGIRPQVLEARLYRIPDGVWLPEPGHFRRLAQPEPSIPKGLAVAGAHRVAPTLEGAIRSGIAAADRLISGAA